MINSTPTVRPRTVIDFDGTKEPELLRKRVPVRVELVPMPTTDRKLYAPWVALLHIGAVSHAA